MILLSVDFETTGPDPENDRGIQAATLRIPDGAGASCPEPGLLYIDPGPDVEIPAEATAVHGITREYLMASAPVPTAEAVQAIIRSIHECWADGGAVIIYNAPFDLTLLDRESRRTGGTGGTGFEVDGLVIDPLVLDKHFDKYRPGSRRLVDVAGHYGVESSTAHDALGDAKTAARIAWKLMGAHDLWDMPAGALMRLQTDAYRTAAESFSAYRIRKGQTAVSGEWPMIAYKAPTPAG